MTHVDLKPLIDLAVGGDHGATAQLLVLHSGRLAYRLRTRLELNPFADFSAEDVLQEVYIEVFKSISSFRAEDSAAFSAWLNKVTDNRLAKTMRDRSRKKRGGRSWQVQAADSSIRQLVNDLQDERAETASELFLKQEVTEAIKVCVAALPDQQREVIELYYLQQKKLDEIAESMRITKDAARGLLYRAKKAMRELMGGSSRWFREK